MHSNCIELNVPWEIMIKGSSGHYYLRDRLAEVIDEKMNENKKKIEDAERAEVIETHKPKISVKKVNQHPKLKIKTVKSKKPVEEITIIREPRQVGEGNENIEDKNIQKIDEVAAPAAAEAVAAETPAVEQAAAAPQEDTIVGAAAPAAVVPARTLFKPLTPIKLPVSLFIKI